MTMQKHEVDAPLAIVAGLTLAAIGAIFYNILPLFIGSAQDFQAWSPSEAGLIGTVFFAGYTLVTISGVFWARKINWRIVCLLSAPLAAAPMAVTGHVTSYPLIAACVFVSGGAFSAIYLVATIAIADTSNPSRWMGAKIGAETALGAIFLIFSPVLLIEPHGFKGIVYGVAGIALLSVLFLAFFPARGRKGNEGLSTTIVDIESGEKCGMLLLLLSLVVFFLAQTALWAFLERTGNSSGFDPSSVGTILAISLGTAMLGAFTEAAIGEKMGIFNAVLFANILFVLGALGLYFTADITLYAISAWVVTFSVGFGVSLYMAAVAIKDRSGRYIILAVPALGLGAAFGPGLAGFILEKTGGIGLLVLASLAAVFAVMVFRAGLGRLPDNVPASG